MSRVKGEYVALVKIEWDLEREINMLPLQDIKDNAKFLAVNLEKVLKDEIKGSSNVEVSEYYCNFYEVDSV